MLEVNLRAPIALARAFAPGMVERRRGHLVFISSLSGKAASPASSVYSATKFGLRGFALGLREDLRPHRRGRLRDPSRLHPRGRDVRGLAREPAARRRYAIARGGGAGGDLGDRAKPRRGRGRAAADAARSDDWRRGARHWPRRSAGCSGASGSRPRSPPVSATSARRSAGQREKREPFCSRAVIAGTIGL